MHTYIYQHGRRCDVAGRGARMNALQTMLYEDEQNVPIVSNAVYLGTNITRSWVGAGVPRASQRYLGFRVHFSNMFRKGKR